VYQLLSPRANGVDTSAQVTIIIMEIQSRMALGSTPPGVRLDLLTKRFAFGNELDTLNHSYLGR